MKLGVSQKRGNKAGSFVSSAFLCVNFVYLTNVSHLVRWHLFATNDFFYFIFQSFFGLEDGVGI